MKSHSDEILQNRVNEHRFERGGVFFAFSFEESGRRYLVGEVVKRTLVDNLNLLCYNYQKLGGRLMKLVLIIGSGAVGKMTVGQELMKITDLRLFHNHMMIEPVIQVFGGFNGAVIQKLRETIFEEFVKTDHNGMIFTVMWAFDMPSDLEYVMSVAEKFDEVYCVELIADQSVRLERNKTENRLSNKASKRDIEASNRRLIGEDTNHRLVSLPGEIPFANYIRIDNTNLPPEEAAKIIKEKFML